jgi:2-oxoglutarate ferredoxin oxidoreductase subunit gamma
MSQEAFEKFSPGIDPQGVLLYESELVEPGNIPPGVMAAGIPSTRIAEELGRRIIANIVMIGFFASVTGVVGRDAMRKAIADSVPKGSEKLNLTAFEKGYEPGLNKSSCLAVNGGLAK